MTSTRIDPLLSTAEDFDPWALVETDRESHLTLAPDQFHPPGYGAANSTIPPMWLRRVNEGETPRQHAAFRHYCAMGPERTLTACAEELGVSYNTVQRWSSTHDWHNRVIAWDNYCDEQYEQTVLEDLRAMARRHADTMLDGISALATAFAPILDDPDAFTDELAHLPAREQMRLAVAAAKVMPGLMNAERVARGLPTELEDSTPDSGVQIRASSIDDLKKMLSGLMFVGLEHKVAGAIDVRKVDKTDDVDGEDET